MKIAIGADHAGFLLKEKLRDDLRAQGHEVLDAGTTGLESVDYPDYAALVAAQITSGHVDKGVLICSSGVGMSIAANKINGIRAALGVNTDEVGFARRHNDANVLALGAKYTDEATAESLVQVFLTTAFEGGRHARRVAKIEALEESQKGQQQNMNDATRMARSLAQFDPEIADAIRHETTRQQDFLELIASENFTSEAVLEATGSVFTNKYAEGYPGKRYYGGCEYADVVENLAIARAKKLFGAEYANVQPHSGSQANQAAYAAVINPGDTVLGMNLNHGGHLTHGHHLNFSGKTYKFVPYGVRQDNELIDYDEVARLADEHKPKMIIAGASAYSRIIDFKRFREIADSVGAIFLVDMAHYSGLVAGHGYPNPCEHAHIVTTTTHKTLRGPRSGLILAQERFAKDIDRNVFPGAQGGPLVHVIAGKATCFLEAMQPDFAVYIQNVLSNAKVLGASLATAGFRVISGGTDSHLVLIDVFSKGLKGKEAEAALDRAHITVNKNGIPFDTNPPMNPSGIRLGTAALTTRGFGAKEFEIVAALIAEVLAEPASEERSAAVRQRVHALTEGFPLYEWRQAPVIA